MLKLQTLHQTNPSKLAFSLKKSFPRNISLPMPSNPISTQKTHENVRVGSWTGRRIEALASSAGSDAHAEKGSSSRVRVIVTFSHKEEGILSSLISKPLDGIKDLFGRSVLLELISAQLDLAGTRSKKEAIRGYAHRTEESENETKYELDARIPDDFGEVGAVVVQNEHHREMFLKGVVLEGLPGGIHKITCEGWVHSKYDNPNPRVFFTNKPYLPSQTPIGLKYLRKKELEDLRGDGTGVRKPFDRLYDYDVYNDIGSPDVSDDLKRPVLGGKEHPYPRRCRTGRPKSKKDLASESSSLGSIYVPRDEAFLGQKKLQFSLTTLSQVVHAVVTSIDTTIDDGNLGFSSFPEIDKLYSKEGVKVQEMMPDLVKFLKEGQDAILRFDPPETIIRDKLFWLSDEEFARETLAGTNPYSIQLVTEWPLKSKLSREVYGPAESAITSEIVQKGITGPMSIDEALKQKKLFILDYHDLLLPYVKKVRELEGTTLYGSRTLFFLDPAGTLKPLAIELTRPPIDGKPRWRQVFTPSTNSTSGWLWRLAKAHVLAHDSAHHELISHWLRTHCAIEPFIIATNRQLSVMHPIYKLLHPHFRYTMAINALARQALINAGGIIESSFSLKRYSMELSSVVYDQQWQFNLQALPADLISRGMAVEDSKAPHGLKLTIEDYPFANDGLLIWDAIKHWVSDYVNHYYPNPSLIQNDEELQAWWTELRTVGHGDKKDEPWWPPLTTPQDLIDIVTTIAWVGSAHHAAVNFGQYAYGGYFPNRPTIARTKMPTEDPTNEEWEKFLKDPEDALLKSFPTNIEAVKVIAVLNLLSTHSPDEEYLGEKMEPSWNEDSVIRACFEKLNGRLKEIEEIIDQRNLNTNLKNRNGAGIVPYELLKPFSKPGLTGKGVPSSTSI